MQFKQVAALIVAAGRGSRARSEKGIKQYVSLGGDAVIAHSVRSFGAHPLVDLVQVVIHADDGALYREAIAGVVRDKVLAPVTGGATRQESVRLGLEALAVHAPSAVLIHDAARPFIDAAAIDGVLEALATAPGAIVAVPVVDTLKRAGPAGRIKGTLSREGLWRAQTPQGFLFEGILAAHRKATGSGRDDFTDDASIAEAYGMEVALVTGSERNFKITDLADFARAEREMELGMGEYRFGTGFDVHAFAEGSSVRLCGVTIPFEKSLSGHSDADVAMHALTDAIYGAIAEGDIGFHFPPSDPQWKGADSRIFLEHARQRVTARGGEIVNVDVTVLCEAPKIGPHRDAMREQLAGILRIEVGRVAVKATTTERLGFTGRREGIAAMAAATVLLR
jgi:2-C-methyl-D-erythritol 4-phosphate cytidylyltransferase/2-C-methyl-D-erythritol 2,4-cyclodiphosphate synthase